MFLLREWKTWGPEAPPICRTESASKRAFRIASNAGDADCSFTMIFGDGCRLALIDLDGLLRESRDSARQKQRKKYLLHKRGYFNRQSKWL